MLIKHYELQLVQRDFIDVNINFKNEKMIDDSLIDENFNKNVS